MKQIPVTLLACLAGLTVLAGVLLMANGSVSAEPGGASSPSTAYPPPGGWPPPPPTFTANAVAYLPVVAGDPPATVYDMLHFMADGGGGLYEVRHSSGSQARHQTQFAGARFFHTKGNELKAEWEELWGTEQTIYRGTDTSPGNGQYYTLYENDVAGSAWSPRYWREGELYERNPYVVFYRKSDCGVVASGFQRSWLRFEAYHPTYTFDSGIKLKEVVELTWLLDPNGKPIESYFYATGHGLVGWGSSDRGYSYVNEIHAPGQRPNNTREVISCLSRAGDRLQFIPELNFGPLPPGFRAK
jgi:hypothetical protein